jgi:hypothetical protein
VDQQVANLAAGQPQKRRSILDPKFAARDAQQGVVPLKLAFAHGHRRHKRIL